MNPALDAATGALHIAAHGTPAGLAAMTVRNTRPAVAHALLGLEAAQACARVPRLYSLCAHAQASAAHAACAAAAGSPPDAAARRADEHALAAESAREHLWRLMLDWPALLALPAALQADWRARFATLYRRLATPAAGASSSTADTHPASADAPTTAGRSALAAELAEDLSTLADELAATLPAALTTALDPPLLDGSPQAHRDAPVAHAGFLATLLPPLDALACTRRLALDEAFAAAPQLDGLCHETGALARHHADAAVAAALAQGRRLAARILARIADLRESALALAGEGRSTTRAHSDPHSRHQAPRRASTPARPPPASAWPGSTAPAACSSTRCGWRRGRPASLPASPITASSPPPSGTSIPRVSSCARPSPRRPCRPRTGGVGCVRSPSPSTPVWR